MRRLHFPRRLAPAVALFSSLLMAPLATADEPLPYEWGNVKIGGGGYVVGVVIHPGEPNLWYVRTDVGGAYRYDSDKGHLVPIIRFAGPEASNLYGVFGLDVHPTDADIVYVALGKYHTHQPHGVFRSDDRGETWRNLEMPNASFAGNGHPHRKGKPLVVNPHNPDDVWVGTREKGLYRYDAASDAWRKVEAIPDADSIRRVLFHPTDPQRVFVATFGQGVFQSTDGGATFEKLGEGPGRIGDADLSSDGTTLFAASHDGVFRFRLGTDTAWQDATPGDRGQYRTVTTSPHDPQTVFAPHSKWQGIRNIWRSDDGGDSWRQIEVTHQQTIPWHPEGYPGASISQFAVDPHNPNVAIFTDWYSVWRTENLNDETVHWTNAKAYGHEEVVSLVLAAPGGGEAFLFSGHADVSGHRHTSLDDYPPHNISTQVRGGGFAEVNGLAVAESDPSRVYVLGTPRWDGNDPIVAVSDDNGKTWQRVEGFDLAWGWGRLAVSVTDKDRVVAATRNGGVRYSADGGQTWQGAAGTPDSGLVAGNIFAYMAPLAADGAEGNRFYVYHRPSGALYRSDDGGAAWSQVADGLSWGGGGTTWHLSNAPGQAGHLWLNLGENGMARTTDGGESWQRLENVERAQLLAVGRAETDDGYPAVFFLGRTRDETREGLWYYRSTDGGSTWQPINDEHNRVGNAPQVMAADRQTFGRVYIGTNGSGVNVGSPAGQ